MVDVEPLLPAAASAFCFVARAVSWLGVGWPSPFLLDSR